MASTTRSLRALFNSQAVRNGVSKGAFSARPARNKLIVSSTFPHPPPSLFHTTSVASSQRAHNNEEIPESAPTTDFSRLDMLGQMPAPSTSVDICSSDGFQLNSGLSVHNGGGVILVGGEAFEWRPWGADHRLINAKGQWEVPEGAFGLLELLWPRPGMS